MPWTKFDDGFHEHPKTVAMSDKAFRLFACSVTYSGRHRLRGRLTPNHLVVLFRLTGAKMRHVDELVALKSYDRDGNDVLIHGFEDYNPDNEELRRKRAEAGKAGADKRWHDGKPIASAMSTSMANDSNGSTRGGSPIPEPEPMPVPEPIPEPTAKSSASRRAVATRGTRLPKPFEPPADWIEFAVRERPEFDANIELASFADYWHGVPDPQGLKADWFATWRNRVRSKFYGEGQAARKNGRGHTIQSMNEENLRHLKEQGIF